VAVAALAAPVAVIFTVSCASRSAQPATPSGDTEAEAVAVTEAAVVETTESVPVSGAAAYAEDSEALTRGNGLFRALCTGYCHTTREANRVAPNLFDCSWTHGDSDAEIFAVVSGGVAETQMQGFGGKLPDEDLWKIIAFIRSRSTCE
jgi:mono/diheme cytochrome c family protein